MPALELEVASGAALDVRRFVVREAISEPFTLSVVAHTEDPSLDLDAIVGRAATFHLVTGLAHAAYEGRRWTGICRAAELERAEPTGLSTYRFDLVPALFRLSQRRDHRIFQHRSAPDIAADLLRGWNIEHAFAVDAEAHPRLPYKVQYDESDYAFLCRILEEAGLAFTFPERDAMAGVLTVSDRLHTGEPRAMSIAYQASPDEAAEQEFLSDLRIDGEVCPGAYTLRDVDIRRPALRLFAEADKAAPPEARLERYHYRPGGFRVDTSSSGTTPAADDEGAVRHDADAGERWAKRALASERVNHRVISFRTNAVDLWPGRVFTLTGHPHPELSPERRLLVTELRLEGAVGESSTILGKAVLADAPYHPPLHAPRPSARLQSATVVGPLGSEIHTDELGRVRVHFPWDRSADLRRSGDLDAARAGRTGWIRVSQAWAGAGHGMMALPRIGQEVLVDFLDGDPEEPIIVGRLFNRTSPVIEPLPAEDTRSAWKSDSSPSSGGFNEILLDDRKGSELLYEQAERDARRLVQHDDT